MVQIKSAVELDRNAYEELIRNREAEGDSGLRIVDDKLAVAREAGTDPVMAPTADEVERLARARKVKFSQDFMFTPPGETNAVPRALGYWSSDERVDRYGDIVRQVWDFEHYRSNPVLLYGHESWRPPIGVSIMEEVKNRKDGDYDGPSLHQLVLFSGPETDPQGWSDKVFRLAYTGIMRAVSVGFIPRKILRVEDEDERVKLGLGRWGVVFEDNMLTELSVCSLPALPSAIDDRLVTASAAGVLNGTELSVVLDGIRSESGSTDVYRQRCGEAVARWSALFGDQVEIDADRVMRAELDVPLEAQGRSGPVVVARSRTRAPSKQGDNAIGKLEAAADRLTKAAAELTAMAAAGREVMETTKDAVAALADNAKDVERRLGEIGDTLGASDADHSDKTKAAGGDTAGGEGEAGLNLEKTWALIAAKQEDDSGDGAG